MTLDQRILIIISLVELLKVLMHPQSTRFYKAGEKIIEWWDNRFPFATINRNNVFVGYGVTCGCHTNADGTCVATPCKKSLQVGASGMTEDEARKRLKRWLVLAQFSPLDPAQQRQSHIAKGGTQLRELASDVCGWSELDADLDILLTKC